MKYLGIDHGDKRIGLATGDDDIFIASPFEIVEVSGDEVAEICLLIREEGIEQIILGLPVSLHGGENAQARKVRKFGSALEKESGLKVIYEDERMTSKQADALLREALPERRDAVAAMVILQSYLDRNKGQETRDKK